MTLAWYWYVLAAILVAVAIAMVRADRYTAANTGYLYFIGGRKLGPIKVGVTKRSPEEKLENLQAGNVLLLKMHGWVLVEDPDETEGRIHNVLGPHHLEDSWYAREPALEVMRELMP